MFVIPVIFYMFTGLIGYLVDLKISCDARKLTRISRIIKKKFILFTFKLQITKTILDSII
jgi:hypothetical protein